MLLIKTLSLSLKTIVQTRSMSPKRSQSSFSASKFATGMTFFVSFHESWNACSFELQRSRLLSTLWHIAVLLSELMAWASYSIVGLEWRLMKTETFGMWWNPECSVLHDLLSRLRGRWLTKQGQGSLKNAQERMFSDSSFWLKQLRLCKSCTYPFINSWPSQFSKGSFLRRSWECWRIQHNPAIKSDIFRTFVIFKFTCTYNISYENYKIIMLQQQLHQLSL